MFGHAAVPGQNIPKGQTLDLEDNLQSRSRMFCPTAVRPECMCFLPWVQMQSGDLELVACTLQSFLLSQKVMDCSGSSFGS